MVRHKAGPKRTLPPSSSRCAPLPPPPEKGLLRVKLPPSCKNGTLASVYSPVQNTSSQSSDKETRCEDSSSKISEVTAKEGFIKTYDSTFVPKRVRIVAESDPIPVVDDQRPKDADAAHDCMCDKQSVPSGKEAMDAPANNKSGGANNYEKKNKAFNTCIRNETNFHPTASWLQLGQFYKGFCSLLQNQCHVPRISYDSVSPKEFFEQFVICRRPCVLTVPRDKWDEWSDDTKELDFDAAEGIDQLKKLFVQWRDNEYLADASQSIEVDVEFKKTFIDNFGEGWKKKMQFDNFINKLSDDSEYYMTTQTIRSSSSGKGNIGEKLSLVGPLQLAGPLLTKSNLALDFPSVPSILPSLVPHQYNLWAGASTEGTSTGLHHDFHDNLYILVRGTKKFRLFSPRVAEGLGTVGQIKQIHPNGLICYQEGVRADGANETEVIKWRMNQATTEIKILEERHSVLKTQIDCLSKLLNKEKKKKVKSSTLNETEKVMLQTMFRQLKLKTSNLSEATLLTEINTRTESAGLVKEYIEKAAVRLKKLADVRADLALQRAESNLAEMSTKEDLSNIDGMSCESSDDVDWSAGLTSESLSVCGATSLDFLEASLTEKQQQELQQTQEKVKETADKNSIFESSDELWGDLHEENNLDEDILMDNYQPGAKPFHFCHENTLLRAESDDLSNLSEKLSEADDAGVTAKLLKLYEEVELNPGDMLYLPASWFHEVISMNEKEKESKPKASGHMAFNYWLYPPCVNDFAEPYPDEFWARRYKKLLEVAQRDLQTEQFKQAALKSPLFEMLSPAFASRLCPSQLMEIAGALYPYGNAGSDQEEDEDEEVIVKSFSRKKTGKKKHKNSKKESKAAVVNTAAPPKEESSTTDQDIQDNNLSIKENVTKGNASVREAFNKHMLLRNRSGHHTFV